MEVVVIETRPLGDRSYLVHDGQVALVIDPQRDTDRVEAAAAAAHVRITHVAETHLHNDYLTGGLILARTHGAVYLVNGADAVEFERTAHSRRRHGPGGPAHPEGRGHAGPHPPPPQLRGDRRAGTGGVFRRQPAVRVGGQDGPGHSGGHRKAHSRAVLLRPPAHRRGPAGRCPLPHPRVRLLLFVRAGVGRPWVHHGRAAGQQPCLHGSGRGPLCAGAHQKPDRLSVLLRAHGPGQPAGPGPGGPRPSRNRSIRPNSAAGWRTASGWWTCATAWRSPAATCRGR